MTLLFSTTRGPISWAIRFFTWSDFSHVDVVLPDGRLLGARLNGGVQIRPAAYLGKSRTARFHVDLTPEQETVFWTFLRAQIGKPYDYTAIIGFPFRRDWQDEDHWFCSELVAAASAAAGVPLLREPKNRVTPRDLLISPRMLPDLGDLLARMLKGQILKEQRDA